MRATSLAVAVLAAFILGICLADYIATQHGPRRPPQGCTGSRRCLVPMIARLRGGEMETGDAALNAAMQSLSTQEREEGEAAALLAQQREARKKAKAEEKAAKKATKASNPGWGTAAGEVEVPLVRFEGGDLPQSAYGDLEMSHGGAKRWFVPIGVLEAGAKKEFVSDLDTDVHSEGVVRGPMRSSGGVQEGERVWVRGRVQQVRAKGSSVFIVLRKALSTVQITHVVQQVAIFKSEHITKGMLKFCGGLTKETIVDVYGAVSAASVEACTVSGHEILAERVYCVSRSMPVLPLLIEDAGRREKDIDTCTRNESDVQAARVGMETRLNHRCLSLRAPGQNAIMRVQAAVSQLFREALGAHKFLEIHSPKLQSGTSEGGAAVFRLDYFGKPACLAQSPQLFKQMAVMSDFERVYEIAPVFRAEPSNTHRHLCEFTGLDFEMEDQCVVPLTGQKQIVNHYSEVLDVLELTLVHMFDKLKRDHAALLAAVAQQYPFDELRYRPAGQNVRLSYPDAIGLLRDDGAVNEDGSSIQDMQDLSTALERQLGSIVSRKYETDLFFLDRFPAAHRPFYTMPSPTDPAYSHSFDAYVRGQEVCSGSQRIHNSTLLAERAVAKGIDPSTIQSYIDSFRYGASPHGGAGLGLERIVMLFLSLDDVRYCSLFPRDPNRCAP